MARIVYASPDLERAATTAQTTVVYPRQRPGKNSLNDIVFAGGGSGEYDYRGKFKVVIGSASNKVKIIDGSKPNSEYCGTTDFGRRIPVSEVSISDDESIYLFVTKDGYNDYDYHFGVGSAFPENVVLYREIAYVDFREGEIYDIEQRFFSGEGLFFAGEYIL